MKSVAQLILGLLLLPGLSIARPISYPGGTTVMQMNDADRSALHIDYSPTARYSLGYGGEYWRDEEWQFHGMNFNYLIKRWNQRSSQANAYLKSAIGLAKHEGEAAEVGALAGIALDWEDRRFFTSYENQVFDAGNDHRFFTQSARIGIAPYIGDYGDLHTWLMLQVEHHPEMSDHITVTPLVRLFKNEYLTEIGINEDGDTLLNITIVF